MTKGLTSYNGHFLGLPDKYSFSLLRKISGSQYNCQLAQGWTSEADETKMKILLRHWTLRIQAKDIKVLVLHYSDGPLTLAFLVPVSITAPAFLKIMTIHLSTRFTESLCSGPCGPR